MCGILGTLPKTENQFFKKALDTLTHRGPDSYGIWTNETEITLGQRRLAILDLSLEGHQPMHDVSYTYSIVLNGEIYNFVELKKQLESKGYRFRSESDTEVLLYSYIEWGKECVHKFNGMWAFAIWNNKSKELFLSRDRFGKKPLFYTFVNQKFIFASEMKAIYPFLPQMEPSEDFDWMYRNIFLYERTEKCLVKGIKRFPAGHNAVYKNGELKIERYWNTLDNLPEIPQKYEEQVALFRELFIDACKIRMRSDVPVGTALSGGLDSSATISTMAYIAQNMMSDRVSNNWQHAFVATFPNTPLDESEYARKVVDYLNIKASYLAINPLNSIDKLNDHLYLFEELYLTSPIPMMELYSSIRKNKVIVTLDGHGADELFAGYGTQLFEALPDALFNSKKIAEIFETYKALYPQNKQFTNTNKSNILLYFDYFLRKQIARLKGKVAKSYDSNHFNFNKLDHFNKFLYTLTHDTILPTLLRNYDRYAMASGIEIRMPFMDYRIVTFAMALPWDSKIRNGFTKNIVRDALQEFMPEEIAYRKTKIGFNSPIVDWMKNDLKTYFLDIVHSHDFNNCNLIDSNKVKMEIESVIYNPNASYGQGEAAWSHLTPYLWEKAILKRRI